MQLAGGNVCRRSARVRQQADCRALKCVWWLKGGWVAAAGGR